MAIDEGKLPGTTVIDTALAEIDWQNGRRGSTNRTYSVDDGAAYVVVFGVDRLLTGSEKLSLKSAMKGAVAGVNLALQLVREVDATDAPSGYTTVLHVGAHPRFKAID